ncbi:MAG: bile acid:sodium symporter [Thermodesulfobacteriota bacterium]|nr:bile acid:sodium symporter [Thermodesulfobacteriota bacterium]
MLHVVKRYWFLSSLVLVAAVTLGDAGESVAGLGRWLQRHHGPDGVIFSIFLLSGLGLDARRLKSGLTDAVATLSALTVIFVVSPLTALALSAAPLSDGLRIGLMIVALMPTTLSSGVVMTGVSGGNMANALLITVIANFLGILTVPLGLDIFLGGLGAASGVPIPRLALTVRIASLVAFPLMLGMILRPRVVPWFHRFGVSPDHAVGVINGCLVLVIVWIALSTSRRTIVGDWTVLIQVVPLAVAFHAVLLAASGLVCRLLKLPPGRRESVIFMGSQKTLPLSILVQVAVFPDYGKALVFCVVHHLVHLMMDGYVAERLKP